MRCIYPGGSVAVATIASRGVGRYLIRSRAATAGQGGWGVKPFDHAYAYSPPCSSPFGGSAVGRMRIKSDAGQVARLRGSSHAYGQDDCSHSLRLPGFGPRELARYPASTNAFPHAKEWVGGGCIRPIFASHRAVIYTCDACTTARQQWEDDYDTKR